jgi:hypothetical protein
MRYLESAVTELRKHSTKFVPVLWQSVDIPLYYVNTHACICVEVSRTHTWTTGSGKDNTHTPQTMPACSWQISVTA